MENRDNGFSWAEKVYKEKLDHPGSLPNIGDGYTDEHRAAYAVRAIAERKLYVYSKRGGHTRLELPLSKKDSQFWHGVYDRAEELIREDFNRRYDEYERSQRNPFDDVLPAGFAGFEDVPVAQTPRDICAAFLGSLKRGDVLEFEKNSFEVWRAAGVHVLVTKAGTKGTKLYRLNVVCLEDCCCEVVEVYPGSGDDMGKPPIDYGCLV